MDAIIVTNNQSKGIKYLTFGNPEGKKWSIPMRSMQMALEIYEPSGIMGKLLKRLLPLTARLGVAKWILHGSYVNVELTDSLKQILAECFGEEYEYSVFWGTPCIDQKVTIQIFRKRKILGYCKIGSSERVKALFRHEKEVLEQLQHKGMTHVPRCMALQQVSQQCWAFIQSTEKVCGSETEHEYGEKHIRFLEQLWETTKRRIMFEETDFYKSLQFLEEHLELLEEKHKKTVTEVLRWAKTCYYGKEVEWGVVHRDFTPWNTCLAGGSLFVFDFEYAHFHAPKELDSWHYFVQTKYFENKCNVHEIADAYLRKYDKHDDIFMQCYLLDIISLYLLRGEKNDMDIVAQRLELMSIIWNRREICDGKHESYGCGVEL